MKRLGDIKAKHLYSLNTATGKVEVDANSAAQARKVAEKSGYIVRDVNMIA